MHFKKYKLKTFKSTDMGVISDSIQYSILRYGVLILPPHTKKIVKRL